jgi:hypothetical protein
VKRRFGCEVLLLGCGVVAAGCAGSGDVPDAAAGSCDGTDAAPTPPTAPAPLMHADFQARSAGPYTADMVDGDFGGWPTWNNGLDEGRATIVDEAGNRFLRVSYPAGKYGPQEGGVQFVVPLASAHDDLYLSYRFRFAGDFQFVQGGKLPGLVGGTSPTGCNLDPAEVSGGFSARMMWRTAGTAVQLVYTSKLVNTCGDDFPYVVCGSPARFSAGAWHQVVHHLRMNTPAQTDGVLEAWLDGTLALARHDVPFRGDGASFGSDALYFSTFFGGGDASWAPASDQRIDFDDFVVFPSPAASPP